MGTCQGSAWWTCALLRKVARLQMTGGSKHAKSGAPSAIAHATLCGRCAPPPPPPRARAATAAHPSGPGGCKSGPLGTLVQGLAWFPEEASDARAMLVRWVIAFARASKAHLRPESDLHGELQVPLPLSSCTPASGHAVAPRAACEALNPKSLSPLPASCACPAPILKHPPWRGRTAGMALWKLVGCAIKC